MTLDEMNEIAGVEVQGRTVSADGWGDRTLLYGYDVDRRTHHVYQKDGVLHLMVYTDSVAGGALTHYVSGEELPLDGLVPNKRLYPEACDYVFCRRLREAGIRLPFTTYDPERAPKTFYGLLLEHFTGAEPSAPGPR
jgi:hypothetical protein